MIQVDVRGERIGSQVPVAFPLVGTVKNTVDALLPMITVKTDSGAPGPDDRPLPAGPRPRGPPGRGAAASSPMHPQFVAATIDRLAAGDAIFTADVGTPCIWAARYLRMNGSRRLIGSFNHGIDGQCAAARHRGPGQPARPSGRQPVRVTAAWP